METTQPTATLGAPAGDELAFDIEEVKQDVSAVDIGDFAADEDERILFRYLRRRQLLELEIQRIKDNTTAMIRSLESKLKGIDYVYTPIAEEIVARKLKGKKAKSLKTPFGTTGFRTVAAKVAVADANVVLGWAELDPARKDIIRVKREVAMAALADFFKATGEVPPGCELVPGAERFYV